MRLILAIAILFGCGPKPPPCFECGLTDEWARAKREEQERAVVQHRENLATIHRAVVAGEAVTVHDAGEISAILWGHDASLLEALAGELEQTCQRQPARMLQDAYVMVIQEDASQAAEARRRAFVRIAASRGSDARGELGKCAESSAARLCEQAFAMPPCTPK